MVANVLLVLTQKSILHKEKNMKSILIILLTLVLIGCEQPSNYQLAQKSYVPDSLKQAYATYVTELVKAATNNLTTCDYEDVDDTIEEAEKSAMSLYQVNELVLQDKSTFVTIRVQDMSPTQKQTFDSLMNRR